MSPPSRSSAPPPGRRGEQVVALDAPRSWLRRHGGGHALHLSPQALVLEHGRCLREPLRVGLGGVALAAVEPGGARARGEEGRFPILRRLGPTAVIPRSEGIEGWLWTSTGGTALSILGEEDEAPNVALVFAKPLDETRLRAAFDPDFLTALAARSPLGSPTVLGVLFRVADTLAAENGFRRWGFQSVLTDKEVPPTLRRHLPTDRPADPVVRASDAGRAATSVPPPGFS
jgi:hypothetical protein